MDPQRERVFGAGATQARQDVLHRLPGAPRGGKGKEREARAKLSPSRGGLR